MCFLTTKENAILRRAESDMKVYKIVTTKNESGFYRFPYKAGQLFSIEDINVELVGDYARIEEGFHSYADMKTAEERLKGFWIPRSKYHHPDKVAYKIVRCTIPQGARYAIDDHRVVSNKLLFDR